MENGFEGPQGKEGGSAEGMVAGRCAGCSVSKES